MSLSQQVEDKDIIVFSKFEGMNTQSDRHDLMEEKAAWMENLQPIGPNNLLVVPAPANALATLAHVITREYYFNAANTDYEINILSDGSAVAVINPGGTTVNIAPASTFSLSPDITQWNTERILIADPTAGYCTWDGTVFVKSGGLSPNIQVTAGGSGYTSPTVTVAGGAGAGATFTATQVGGVVTKITLTNAGTGYLPGDTVTLTVHDGGPGTGATATAHVWPTLVVPPTTLAVFQGRVWLAAGNIGTYTGTGADYNGVGYDDFLAADAAGSFTIQDPDLVHSITALRSLNNYLFIVGDASVKQIGNISVTGTTTSFTIVTLSSDQGTLFRDTVVSFNRLVLFANTVGVYAVFGTSVEKISDDMDGIFRLVDFTQLPTAAVNDINNIHCFLLLVKYNDPIQGARSLILAFMNKKWFVMSQGAALKLINTANVKGKTLTFGTSGTDVTQILSDATKDIAIRLSTSLTSHGKPFVSKNMIRYAVVQSANNQNTLSIMLESERAAETDNYSIETSALQFINNSNQNITFIGAGGNPINFVASSVFQYQASNTHGVPGVYLGATLTGSVSNFRLNSIMIEYKDTAVFGPVKTTIGGQ